MSRIKWTNKSINNWISLSNSSGHPPIPGLKGIDMFTLSQTAGYAIQALTCLADETCSRDFMSDIAECSGVPSAYLAKIMKRLNNAGLVGSKRGYKGGVWLTRPPGEITLWDVSAAIDGDEFMSQCLLGDEHCDDMRDCPTHQFWKKERAKIQAELVRTTVADVVTFKRRKSRSSSSG